MAQPPEVCHEHDLPLDGYGCWACGHAGPITDLAWPSWARWCSEADLGTLSRAYARGPE